MDYVKVLVASNSYHGDEALTYHSEQPTRLGSVVQVPLRRAKVSAIVIGKSSKPSFTTKAILGTQITEILPTHTLELARWLSQYYPAPSGAIVSQFLPSNLLAKPSETLPLPRPKVSQELPALTKQQSEVIQQLRADTKRTALIHGDTGTGKTRIYLELTQECLTAGRSVIILTPEIGLTSQLAASFERLGAPVLVFHSNLTARERRELWLQILHAAQPLVVVGPRSALFTPVANVGLIVVDEAHDNAYKQEQAPRYHALRVAAKLAQLHRAQLIFGTATPLVTEYFYLEARQVPIYRLTEIARGNDHPPKLQVVDTSDRNQFSRSPYLSNILLDEVTNTISQGKQALIFLNRRGTARIVLCQNGDWQALCPRCDIPLTYHGDNHTMRCHTCGYKAAPVTSCPVCGNPEVVFKSIGTKAITETLIRLFPKARVQRFDTDNTKQERLEQHYEAVRTGKVDILVGTQLLVKGLDLPQLATVGVVAADSSLYFPDYTAEEQTYQLLTQVIGRVGRGHGQSSVVVQTSNPSGRALQAAISKDWPSFYQAQLAERKRYHFPPFYHVLKLSVSRRQQASATRAATQLKSDLQAKHLPVEIIGPAPQFYEKQNDSYHWQLIVRAKQRDVLLSVIKQLPANWTPDIDPLNLL
jgi:primosomal protein N' (replication factor Y)